MPSPWPLKASRKWGPGQYGTTPWPGKCSDMAPDGQIVLSPEAAVCMANHLALNATVVQDIQTAILAEGFVCDEEEAS